MARKNLPTPNSSQKNEVADNSKVGCFRCGLCCTLYRVHLTLGEAHCISKSTGLALDDFTDDIGLDGDEVIIRRFGMRCIFLEETADKKVNLCRIHTVRPIACQEWEGGLWRPACQRGLSDYWNIKVSPELELEGRNNDIANFNTFLKTLGDR